MAKNKILLALLTSFTLFMLCNSSMAQSAKNKQTMTKVEYQKNINNLTDFQKFVTQKNGTEPAFQNEFWNNKKDGIYVDAVSGKPLFSSKDKFDSGTGWPSFTKPISQEEIIQKSDKAHGMSRVEIRSKDANSHLGHVFDDGPKDKGGKRFCINSAAMRFIPKDALEKEGYGQYLNQFESSKNKSEDKTKSETKNKPQKALLAGGCFWGMEELLGKFEGVISTNVGYSGGNVPNPTYELITTGLTNHAETIEITFDPTKTSYEKILKFFFTIHDPTTPNRQQNDVGSQYRSEIFYLNDEQKIIAEKVVDQAQKSGVFHSKIVTKISKADKFYKAEENHQNYLKKNPHGYTCHHVRDEWKF